MIPDFIQIGVTATALSDDLRQAPAIARQLGFGGLQFDAYSSNLHFTDLSGTGRREFRNLLSAQNQQLVGLRVDLGSKGFGPGADVDRLLSQLDRVMESAVGLGSPLVCVELGRLPAAPAQPRPRPKITAELAGLILLPPSMKDAPEAAPEPPPAAPIDPAFTDQVNAAMADLGRRADRYSAIVAFRSELASLASLEHVLRATDCPWFGVDFDPSAVQRDEWDLDEAFSRLGPHIRHVRGRDATGGADRRTKPAVVGEGDTNWDALLSYLDDAGYHGWITVDPTELPDRVAAASRALKRLRGAAPGSRPG